MYLDVFSQKEVISIKDCRKLGYVCNLEFDECSGCICQLVVKEKSGFWGMIGAGEECTISYQKIKQIGPDLILVDL